MNYRNQQYSIPMYVRTQIQGTEPRTIQIGPIVVPPDMKSDVLLIDAKVKITLNPEQQAQAGQSFQGLIKTGKLTIDGTPRLSFKRDCLVPLVKALAMLEGLPRQNDMIDTDTLYDDVDPINPGQTDHNYYMLVGPFSPGTYFLTLEFNRLTDEFPQGATLVADIGMKVDISPIEPGDRFLEAESDQKFSANELTLANIDGGIVFCKDLDDKIDTISVDGVALPPVGYESFWRTWLQHFNEAWNAAQRPDDLGWIFVTRRTIDWKFNTAASVDWVVYRLYGGLPSKVPPWVPPGQSTIQGQPPISRPPTVYPPSNLGPAPGGQGQGQQWAPPITGGPVFVGTRMTGFREGKEAHSDNMKTMPEQRELDPTRIQGAL